MKTFLFNFFAICLFFCGSMDTVEAQSPFTKESNVVHLGAGLGGGYGTNFGLFTNISSTPIINVFYDKGLIDDLGIGNLGIGGGIGTKFYSYEGFGDKYNWTRIFIAGRATYHFHFVNSEKFDFYGGVMAGLYFETGDDFVSTSGTGVIGGPLAGIHYWFTPNLAVYAESGFGFGFLNGGIAFGF